MDDNQLILESFLPLMPYLRELFISDTCVALTDREKYIYYQAGKSLDLKITVNLPLKMGTAVYKAIHEKHRNIVRGDKTVFGVPYIAVAVPIFNAQHETVGTIVIAESVERQDAMREIAVKLNEDISVLASTTEEISAQTEEIAAVCRARSQVAQESLKRVQDTDQVLRLIKAIAGQTNLLGLNAAIEAARVGDQGRGFGVVAGEIRKLAADSAESIKKIESIIQGIQADSAGTSQEMERIDAMVSQIADAVSHVAAAVERSNTMAQRLNALADSLS